MFIIQSFRKKFFLAFYAIKLAHSLLRRTHPAGRSAPGSSAALPQHFREPWSPGCCSARSARAPWPRRSTSWAVARQGPGRHETEIFGIFFHSKSKNFREQFFCQNIKKKNLLFPTSLLSSTTNTASVLHRSNNVSSCGIQKISIFKKRTLHYRY